MVERLSGAFWHPCVFGACGRGRTYRKRRAAYLIVRDAEGRLACERGSQGGLYLVGGGLDPEESPEEAVVREVHEEAGARVAGLRFVGALREWFVQPDGRAAWDQTGYFFVGDLVDLPAVPPRSFLWAREPHFLAESVYDSASYAVERLARAGRRRGRRLQPA